MYFKGLDTYRIKSWGDLIVDASTLGRYSSLDSSVTFWLKREEGEFHIREKEKGEYAIHRTGRGGDSSEFKKFKSKKDLSEYLDSELDLKMTAPNFIANVANTAMLSKETLENHDLDNFVTDVEFEQLEDRVDELEGDSYAKGGLVKKSDYTMLGAGLLLGGLFSFLKK